MLKLKLTYRVDEKAYSPDISIYLLKPVFNPTRNETMPQNDLETSVRLHKLIRKLVGPNPSIIGPENVDINHRPAFLFSNLYTKNYTTFKDITRGHDTKICLCEEKQPVIFNEHEFKTTPSTIDLSKSETQLLKEITKFLERPIDA